MFERPFPFRKARVRKDITSKYLIRVLKYTFDIGKTRYMVDVEHYQLDFYIIKFYPKKLADYKLRFNILTNEYHASRTVSTCLHIIKDILIKEKAANFGFMGSPILDTQTNHLENRSNNKRFRVYKYAFENFFGSTTFSHYIDPSNSTYIIVNNIHSDPDRLMESATTMFSELFPDLNSI